MLRVAGFSRNRASITIPSTNPNRAGHMQPTNAAFASGATPTIYHLAQYSRATPA